jgi:hypothetical protein
MTIEELIEQLEDARQDMSAETEIPVAIQPSWPLRCRIQSVTVPPADQPNDEDRDENPAVDADDATVLWIAVDQVGSSENPYAPRWAWGE